MGQIDIQVVIQLWQVVFASIMGCAALITMGFTAAIIFVRKGECVAHRAEQDKKYDQIIKTQSEMFGLIRDISETVNVMKGEVNAIHK